MRSQPTSRPCWDHLWHVWHWIRCKQILPFVTETLHWQRIRRLQSQNDQWINRIVCCWLRSKRLNGQGSSLFWQDRWFVQTSQVTSQSRSSIEQDTIKQGGHLWIRSRNLNQFFSKLLFFSLTTLTQSMTHTHAPTFFNLTLVHKLNFFHKFFLIL